MKAAFQAALSEKKEIFSPKVSGLVILLIIGLAGYITLAIFFGANNGKPDYHFAEEKGAITALSSVFLAGASGFAGAAFFFARGRLGWYPYFWILATLVFGFFAFDELFQFHEKIGSWIGRTEIGSPQYFRNWNDVIVMSYGVLSILVGIYFLPEILRYPKLGNMLAVAFAFYFLHTLIDSTQEPRTVLSTILEESAKLYCSGFLAMSMFIGLLGVIAASGKNK